MKYSVCIDDVFAKRSIEESMQQVKEAGLDTIEFWAWWNKDWNEIIALKNKFGIRILAFCTRFISLVDATKREQYVEGLRETIEVARRLDCQSLITQVGDEIPGVPREAQHKSLVDGLKACLPYLEQAGISIWIEPINRKVTFPNYYLYSAEEAFRIVEEVGSPYVKVLYDIYHQQITEGNLLAAMLPNLDKIGHIHAAGVPGHHELDKSEIDYGYIFDAIMKAGYEGWFGLEYRPLDNPVEGLRRWLNRETISGQ
ncbi:TIM barrel protein [Cohnella sp. REN36]|uniref:TIM barrel protein n=1 Tax=Cohnella sp. REN36 TaxID=2887347 RepID=UPI001D152139|nr:TIM barrel protein [Cohnella sp. REN36]MCC3372323.1 TIM barrel protein [Cohnella sp. REN36]